MSSHHQSELRRWWARKLDQLVVWWRQGQNVHISAWLSQTRSGVRRTKAASTKQTHSRPRRRLGEGMLPAVRLPARRAVATLIGLVELGAAAFGVAIWNAISRAIAAHQPVPVPELRDYDYFIAKMNANHARRGLLPVADWLSEQEARRNRQPRRRVAEPQPEPQPQPDGEPIHDLRPNDEWMGPRLG